MPLLNRFIEPNQQWLCQTPGAPTVGDRFQCPRCETKFVAVKRGRPVWEVLEEPGACPHVNVEPEAVGPVVAHGIPVESAHACLDCREWVVPYVAPEGVTHA